MIRVLLGVAAAAVLAVPVSPVAAERMAPLATLAHGEFSARLSPGTNMTCTGYPTRTCTHTWDATGCFEAAADTQLGSPLCDVKTLGTANRTVGTAHWTSATGYVCTTTNLGTTLEVVVYVDSVFFPDHTVNLDVAQTNGAGTFQGVVISSGRMLTIRGTFATPATSEGVVNPCGSSAQPGSFQGEYEITTAV